MTAQELIELLKAHPKACVALGVETPEEPCDCRVSYDGVFSTLSTPLAIIRFRRWLIGAAVEWCDKHGIDTPQDRDCPGKFFRFKSGPSYDIYPSRLHALLAAIEETTT